jgi:glutathione S-transferase
MMLSLTHRCNALLARPCNLAEDRRAFNHGEMQMDWVTLVAMLALLQFMFFGIKVGQARGKYGIKAPATTGNEIFERYFRVHQNTLEQLIVFMPALVAFANLISPLWAAVVGAVYLVGRSVYYAGYIADPEKRGIGTMITMLANVVLVIGAIVGAVLMMF